MTGVMLEEVEDPLLLEKSGHTARDLRHGFVSINENA
jgi:hypothetical protein